jgi:predicted nuclease of predicted toxin-antitoxin system
VKLLLDQNLSYRMLDRLDAAFPGSSHTHDVDFFERSLILGAPPKVLWLNCGNSSTDYVLDHILQRREEIRNLDSDPTLSCLELG